LKQDQYSPMPVSKQITIIFVGTEGMLDTMPVAAISRFETEFLDYVDNKYPAIFKSIEKEKVLSDELKEQIKKAVEEFMPLFKQEG
jgi:F-type H+-transporting ATPase subunit alpha